MSIFQQQREQTRRQILDTAIMLFRQNGYDSVSMEQITKTVGIAKGTFYNFFSSKKEIIMLWAEQEFQKLDLKAAVHPGQSVQENLFRLVENIVDAIESQGQLFASFLQELIHGYDNNKAEEKFDFLAIFSTVMQISNDFERISVNFEEKAIILNNAMFLAVIDWFKLGKPVSGLTKHLQRVISICLFGMISR